MSGCTPSTKGRLRAVKRDVEKAGGTEVIIAESEKLFSALSESKNKPFLQYNESFTNYPAIASLGDVFHYTSEPTKQISIRRYKHHFNTYWIYLVEPDFKTSESAQKSMIGNIIIEPEHGAYRDNARR